MARVSDEFERLDRLLTQLNRILEVPGQSDSSAEWTWEKLELLERSMGEDALAALLRRQGMSRATLAEALEVLEQRRETRP